MLKKSTLEEDINRIMASLDGEDNHEESEPIEEEPIETYHIYPVQGGMVILKEEANPQIVESTPFIPQNISMLPAYAICGLYFFLIVSTLAFQVYAMFNPPIATVTIIPKSRQLTLNGTLQLGRLIRPITISQSQVIPTTGHGHQDAKQATGSITFYNGQFQSVTVSAGTILQGSDGVQIVTNQDATIPAGNPPSYGQVTVSAHAIIAGARGNIPAYDINQIFSNAVLVKNTHSFNGGQDERDFSTVRSDDIHTVSTQLISTINQSMQGALQGQLYPNERLQILPCTSTVSSDHQPGDEATQVKVTVSETCSAVAYNVQELKARATQLLTTKAQQLGTGYSLFGDIHVSVQQASVTSAAHPLVFLSFTATGTWVYAVSKTYQQNIKSSIAGKTKQQALQILQSMPGVERAAIQIDGFGDDTRLPKDIKNIHISLFIV